MVKMQHYMYFWSQYDGYIYCSIYLSKNYGFAHFISAVIDDEGTYYSFRTYFDY